MPDTLLTTAEAAQLLRCQPQTLRLWRCRGEGPRYIRFGTSGRGRALYARQAIDAWLQARTAGSTSEESAARLDR